MKKKRDRARDALAAALAQDLAGDALATLRPRLIESFAAWTLGPGRGSIHSSGPDDGLARVAFAAFMEDLLAAPRVSEVEAAQAALIERLGLADLGR